MSTVLFDFGSIARTADKLYEGAAQARNMHTPLFEIATDMLRVEKQVFASQGRRGGGSWAPLKPATAERKGSNQILRATGALERSVTEFGAQFQILNITNSVIEFGTSRPWAGVHQDGSRKRNIPRRPFIRFTATDTDRWADILFRHLVKPFLISGAG